jgi:hypothetical protein
MNPGCAAGSRDSNENGSSGRFFARGQHHKDVDGWDNSGHRVLTAEGDGSARSESSKFEVPVRLS